MVLTALRGALGFLSRLPVGRDENAFVAFQETPVAVSLAGYVIGAFITLPLAVAVALSIPAPTAAFGFVVTVYLVTGVSHADGVADFGDALAMHGTLDERRTAMKDSTAGAGGVLFVSLIVSGLALAGLALATLPVRAVMVVVAAEVGAKLGMTTLACLGTPAHEGLGATLVERMNPRSLPMAVVVAFPIAFVTWPHPAAVFSLLAALGAALCVFVLARRILDGVSGDVFGAANEFARVIGLHAGVVVWTLC